MAEDVSKAPVQERVHCNRCGRKTLHRLAGTAVDEGTDWDKYVGDIEWRTIFDMLQCCGCGEAILRRTSSWSEDPDPRVHFYPPPVSRHPPRWVWKIPHGLKSILEEIYHSLDANNLSLPMMGARTLMDMLIVEKVGDSGTFKQKLKKLQDAGFVGAKNVEVLDAALDAGSAAAHRGHAPKPSDVNAVMDIVENLLHAVYVLPGMAQGLKKTTPRRVRKTPKP
jgi:hypothetical protein